MKLYHGTNEDFETFEKREGKVFNVLGEEKVEREGFFFSPDKDLASQFGNVTSWDVDIHNTLDLTNGFVDDNIIGNFVNDGWSERYLINLYRENIWELFDGDIGKDFKSTVFSLGYDSVKISEFNLNDELVDAFVVFDSNKIKKIENLSPKEFLSNKMTTPWNEIYFIEDGLELEISNYIQNNPFHDFSMSCQNESERWANLINSKFNNISVEIHHGMYNDEGHTWINIDGFKFDPTASQFDNYPNMENGFYDIYEIEDLYKPPSKPAKNKSNFNNKY